MRIEIDHQWRVRAACDLDVPMSATAVWGQMRDWRRFITIDPLHVRVRVLPHQSRSRRPPPHGIPMMIEHRLLGFGPDRVGRIVRWDEGQGFAFSDLSKRGMRIGFPHICEYDLQVVSDESCRLTIGARGRWTARWWPRWMIRLWLAWVLAETRVCVKQELRRFDRWRRTETK